MVMSCLKYMAVLKNKNLILSYPQHSVERSEAAEVNRRDQIIHVSAVRPWPPVPTQACVLNMCKLTLFDYCKVVCFFVCFRIWKGRTRRFRKVSGNTTRSREPC